MHTEYSSIARPAYRIPRSSTRPTFSIILAAVESRAIAESYLTALVTCCDDAEAELIVVRADGAQLIGTSARHASRIRFVTAPADGTTQELRSLGMRAARGDIILMVDDAAGVELHSIDRIIALATKGMGASDRATEPIRRPVYWDGAAV